MNCPLFLLRAETGGGCSPEPVSARIGTSGGGSGGLLQTLGNRLSLVIIVGQPAWPMEHGQISIGIAMHAHTRFDVVAAMLIRQNLQAQPLKAHAVVGAYRALMSRPKLLLLDEPSMGLAPLMVQKIFETLRAVSKKGVTIFLVEQNAKLALEISHRGYVMESGKIILTATLAALATNPEVRRGYLGE